MKYAALFYLMFAVSTVFAQQTGELEEAKNKLAKAEKKFADWAELNRYASANAQIIQPKKDEKRVVFIGDSITDLWDENGFGGFFPGKPYIDRGISGQTTPQMLVRFRADVINLKPKVVVILAGTNDIAGNTGPLTLEQTGDNIASMAELATANGIKIVLSSVIPVSDTVRRSDGNFFIQTKSRPPAKIVAMNEWLKAYCARNGYTFLDYYSAMVDGQGFVRDGITFDGLHPNKQGYAIMNPLVEAAIQKALKSKR